MVSTKQTLADLFQTKGETYIQCNQHLMNRFFDIFLSPKNTNTGRTEKLCITLLYEKSAIKMLVKLTPKSNSFVKVAVFNSDGNHNARYEHQICFLEVLFTHLVSCHNA